MKLKITPTESFKKDVKSLERGTVQGKKEVFYPRGIIDDLTGLKMKIQGNLKFFFNSDIVTL
jgi:hypothetical protein